MKKLVLVESLSQFLIRHVVEVEDNIEHAVDEVVCNMDNPDLTEFSQKHLGMVVISHREITQDEFLKLFDQDNDYLASWSEEQKLKLINKNDYSK